MEMNNLLEADSINLEFGRNRVLSDIYVKAEVGSITGFLGRNGSGKSCLMQVVFGTLNANNQSVRINKNYVPHAFAVAGLIRYLPQQHFIPKYLKIKDIAQLYDISLENIFEEFECLEKHKNQRIATLSGGEQRLFEVMLVLKSAVKFVILDEPFSNLMPLHIEKLKPIIAHEKTKKGIIITDHLYKHIIDLADNLYLMKEGKSFKIKGLDDLERLGYIMPT